MPRPVRHVIWDWNGTLFDDFDAVLLAMNASCASVGGPEVTADLYRETFTRPIERTYERLLDGGEALMVLADHGFSRRFGWVNDRFGVSWQLNLP